MTTQLPLQFRLENTASFTSYYPGSNAEVITRLQACATENGAQQLYIWGATGYGKTHLLQAACRESDGCGLAAAYLPLRDLGALAPEIVEGLEAMDLVCLDDIETIAGNHGWEIAVFDLFNRLRDAGKPLVIAADQPPHQLGLSLADLSSRLAWGLVYPLYPLNDAEKLEALQQRATARGFELTTDTARYLLRRLPRDTASLFTLLDHLDRESLAAHRKLTIPFVKIILEKTPLKIG